MKNFFFTLVTAALPFFCLAQSSTDQDSGFFGSINAGPSSSSGRTASGVSTPSKADTYAINIGYFYNKNLLFSAGYRGASNQYYTSSSSATATGSSNAFSLVFNGLGIYPVSENVSVTGGVTLMYMNYSGSGYITNNGTTTSYSTSKVGTLPFLNMGGMLQLDKTTYLTLNYLQSAKYDVVSSTSANYGISSKALLFGVLKRF